MKEFSINLIDFIENSISADLVNIFKSNSVKLLKGKKLDCTMGIISKVSRYETLISRIKKRLKFYE